MEELETLRGMCNRNIRAFYSAGLFVRTRVPRHEASINLIYFNLNFESILKFPKRYSSKGNYPVNLGVLTSFL